MSFCQSSEFAGEYYVWKFARQLIVGEDAKEEEICHDTRVSDVK